MVYKSFKDSFTPPTPRWIKHLGRQNVRLAHKFSDIVHLIYKLDVVDYKTISRVDIRVLILELAILIDNYKLLVRKSNRKKR